MPGGEAHAFQRLMRERIEQRAAHLAESHKRVRQAVSLHVRGLEVQPHLPPDLLGVVVLQPMVKP